MPPAERILTSEYVVLSITTVLFFVAFGAINPVLPKYVTDELSGSNTEVGIVVGAVAVTSLLLRPLLGRYCASQGCRRLIVGGALVGAVSMVMLSLVDSVAGAAGTRLAMGAGQGAVITGVMTLAIDISPEHRRGEATSYLFVAIQLGIGSGPVVGELILSNVSFAGVWFTMAVVMAASGVTGRLLPFRLAEVAPEPPPLVHPRGIGPGLVMLVGLMPYASLTVFLPLYGRELGLEHVSAVFLASSAAIVVVRVLLGRLPDALGPIRSTTVALVAVIASSLILAAWTSVTGLYVGAILLSGAGALLLPALIPASVDGVPAAHRASALATFTMFMDLSLALTGPIFGVVATTRGYRGTFVAGAVAGFIGLVMLRWALSRRWGSGISTTNAGVPREFG